MDTVDVSQQIIELTERLNSLGKLYEQVNSDLQFNIGLTWGIIGGIFAIIGVALYFIAKNIIESGVAKATKDAKENIDFLDTRIRDQQGQIDNLRREINEVKNSNAAITRPVLKYKK